MKRSRRVRSPRRPAAGVLPGSEDEPAQPHPGNADQPAFWNDGLDAPVSGGLQEALVYTWAGLLAAVCLIAISSALRAAT